MLRDWIVDGEDFTAKVVDAATGYTVYETKHVHSGNLGEAEVIHVKNMRMGAAAPNLLSACITALECLTSGDKTMYEHPESPYYFLGSAIAKATEPT